MSDPGIRPANATVDAPLCVQEPVQEGVIDALGRLPPGSIVNEAGLAAIFQRHPVSIKRAVSRGELPAPIKLFGVPSWTVKALLAHLEKRLDAAEREREKLFQKISKLSP